MSDLKARLTEDMKSAMRAKDQPRLNTIRSILAAIKQREVDERITLDDANVLLVLDKLAKQRRESITQFKQAQRQDLVDVETFELDIITTYLPEQLSEHAIDDMIRKAIADLGVTSMKDMGKVVAILKPQMQGRADLGAVSAKVKATLSS